MRGRFFLALCLIPVLLATANAGPLRTVETGIAPRGPRIDLATGALGAKGGGPGYDPGTGVFRGLGGLAALTPRPEDGLAAIRRARDYPELASGPQAPLFRRAPAPKVPKTRMPSPVATTTAPGSPAEGVALLGVGLFGFTGYVLRRRRRSSSLRGTP